MSSKTPLHRLFGSLSELRVLGRGSFWTCHESVKALGCVIGMFRAPKGPSTQIVGFQGPKTTQGMDFGT